MQINGKPNNLLYQFSQAVRAQSNQTIRQIEQANQKVEVAKQAVFENAVSQAARSAQIKGSLVDVTA